MGPQQRDIRSLCGRGLDSVIELIDVGAQVLIRRLELMEADDQERTRVRIRSHDMIR
jgi:hypothetical protein